MKFSPDPCRHSTHCWSCGFKLPFWHPHDTGTEASALTSYVECFCNNNISVDCVLALHFEGVVELDRIDKRRSVTDDLPKSSSFLDSRFVSMFETDRLSFSLWRSSWKQKRQLMALHGNMKWRSYILSHGITWGNDFLFHTILTLLLHMDMHISRFRQGRPILTDIESARWCWLKHYHLRERQKTYEVQNIEHCKDFWSGWSLVRSISWSPLPQMGHTHNGSEEMGADLEPPTRYNVAVESDNICRIDVCCCDEFSMHQMIPSHWTREFKGKGDRFSRYERSWHARVRLKPIPR